MSRPATGAPRFRLRHLLAAPGGGLPGLLARARQGGGAAGAVWTLACTHRPARRPWRPLAGGANGARPAQQPPVLRAGVRAGRPARGLLHLCGAVCRHLQAHTAHDPAAAAPGGRRRAHLLAFQRVCAAHRRCEAAAPLPPILHRAVPQLRGAQQSCGGSQALGEVYAARRGCHASSWHRTRCPAVPSPSLQVRSFKPDPEIYAAAEALAGCQGADLAFIDDRADNVAAAAARGWQAIHHTDPRATLAQLAALGLPTVDSD